MMGSTLISLICIQLLFYLACIMYNPMFILHPPLSFALIHRCFQKTSNLQKKIYLQSNIKNPTAFHLSTVLFPFKIIHTNAYSHKHIFVRLSVLTKNNDIYCRIQNMYTVYCYAYYFTIKGTKVGNSGLYVTTRDGISRSTWALLKASVLFLFVAIRNAQSFCQKELTERVSLPS